MIEENKYEAFGKERALHTIRTLQEEIKGYKERIKMLEDEIKSLKANIKELKKMAKRAFERINNG